MLVLDLFSGAGGAGMGYHQAGHTVIGVDIAPQPNYPFTFARMDALEFLRHLIDDGKWIINRRDGFSAIELTLDDVDLIHASPPCQGYTALKAVHGNEWPLLIEPVRELLEQIDKPYVIENVQGAPVRRDLVLCGEMFGLDVIRHRYFEISGFSAAAPAHVPHRGRVRGWRHGEYFDGPYLAVHGEGGGKGTVAEWREAMGIDWTWDRREIAEAIPPAYTRWIGGAFEK